MVEWCALRISMLYCSDREMDKGDMMDKKFDRYAEKLEKNIYGSLKGRMRIELLVADLREFCPGFESGSFTILDAGGGVGYFAKRCSGMGHFVHLLDQSEVMIVQAEKNLSKEIITGNVTVTQSDFLSDNLPTEEKYDLVLLHGSAEWMSDAMEAVMKAIASVKKGGYLSLLTFNKDRLLLKRGINGLLLQDYAPKKKKLIPPEAKTVREMQELLHSQPGRILVQSGIRVFYHFFREAPIETLDEKKWLQQERLYYRVEPFASLGEHTHFLFQKK